MLLADYSLMHLWLIGVADVVQVRDHEALELLIPHILQIVQNVFNQAVMWALHQNQIRRYTFFRGALSVLVYFHENVSDLWLTEK